jgi:hypothetical protein
MSNQPHGTPQYGSKGKLRKSGTATAPSKKAIASLVLGLSSVVFVFFSGIAAIIFGIIANAEISKSGGRLKGQGMAIAGIVLGALGCLWTVVIFLIVLLLPAVSQVRSAARTVQSMDQVREISLGMLNYEQAYKQFPPANAANSQLSWRVHILPFIQQNNLYDQFHLDEPWDSPHNLTLVDQMPDIYASPVVDLGPGKTVYVVPTSPPGSDLQSRKNAAAFIQGESGPEMSQFLDGISNTILVIAVDANAAVTWTQPTDWMFDLKFPNQSLGENGTIVVALADGSVMRIDPNIDDDSLGAFFTRAAGDRN